MPVSMVTGDIVQNNEAPAVNDGGFEGSTRTNQYRKLKIFISAGIKYYLIFLIYRFFPIIYFFVYYKFTNI
jgi:hypothetical protein